MFLTPSLTFVVGVEEQSLNTTRLITMRSKPNCFTVAFLLSLILSCVADIFILSCCYCCCVLNSERYLSNYSNGSLDVVFMLGLLTIDLN